MEREEELKYIRMIKEGNEDAFELFYKANKKLIYKFAHKFCWVCNVTKDSISFDDLISLVSISFFKATQSFDESANCRFSTLFYEITKNEILTEFNKFKRKNLITIPLENNRLDEGEDDKFSIITFLESPGAKKDFIHVEDKICINGLFEKIKNILKPKEFDVFYRIAIKEDSINTVAKDFGVSKQNISKVYLAAKSKVKNYVLKKGVKRFF